MNSETSAPGRIAYVDVLRGIALACMVVFHFSWDLEFFGLAEIGVTENLFWIWFAKSIAAAFLFTVGISLYLAHRDGVRWPAFMRRLGLLLLASGAITLSSRLLDPDGTIWFGILHHIAAASLLGLAFLRLPTLIVTAAAAAVFAAPSFLTSDFFNPPGWLWLGLSREVLPANDYIPLLPWFGNVLAGMAFAKWLLSRLSETSPAGWQPASAAFRLLAFAGRHSLIIYLVHQPIMIGALWIYTQLLG